MKDKNELSIEFNSLYEKWLQATDQKEKEKKGKEIFNLIKPNIENTVKKHIFNINLNQIDDLINESWRRFIEPQNNIIVNTAFGYFMTIVRNHAIDEGERMQNEQNVIIHLNNPEDLDEIAVCTDGEENVAEIDKKRINVFKCFKESLMDLNPKEQDIVIMKRFTKEEYNNYELFSAITCETIQCLTTRYHRALHRLRENNNLKEAHDVYCIK
jgi:DNA-directed RNA polymerase specialized sigma24 family protein